MLFMVWLRLGSTCIKETIRETAKSIASISNGLFKRWQEREKTQGPQKKKNKKKDQHRKQYIFVKIINSINWILKRCFYFNITE